MTTNLASAIFLASAGAGVIDMRVAIGTDQRRHADAVAADIAHEIAEDRKAGDDVEAILRAGGKDRRDKHQTDEPDKPHRYASRCRRGNSCLTRPETLPNSTEPIYSTAATRMIAGPDGTWVWNDSTSPA